MTSQTIWGAQDRGTVQSTDRFPLDISNVGGPYYATATEITTFVSANITPPFSTIASGTNANALLVSGSLGTTGGGTIAASTAAILATARTINGTSFDGSANITVTAAAGTLTGSTLNSSVTSSSLTSVGTLVNLTVTNPITGSITGNAGTVTTISGLVSAGTNVAITGSGTSGSPYVITSTGGTASPGGTNGAIQYNSTGALGGVVITGLVLGNGTSAPTAAVAGTDYQAPITLTTTGSSGAATFIGNTLNIPQYSGGSGTVNSGTGGQLTYYATTGSAVSGNANATISNGALTLGVATSVQGSLILAGSTSGSTTIAAPVSGGGTMTLQAGSDTLVGRATTDTLTNKTLTSPTLTTPVLGTPSSGTLTNCSGLPISSGVSGLGTGVATFLATPSSANLASAITDETGSGALVFATSPSLTTPTLGVATATTINKVTITAPASAATLTIANNKTLTSSNTITLTGTDGVSANVSNLKVRTIGFSVAGATTPSTGQQGSYVVFPVAGTITGYKIVADAGTCTVKTWKIASGTTAPTSSNSISTSGVSLSSGTAIISSTTSDFTTTTVSANDIFGFELSAVATATKILFELEITVT